MVDAGTGRRHFVVRGAYKRTALDANLDFFASDGAEAERIAFASQILVSSVELQEQATHDRLPPKPLAGTGPGKPSTTLPKPRKDDTKALLGCAILVLALGAGVISMCTRIFSTSDSGPSPGNASSPDAVPEVTEEIARSKNLDPQAFYKVSKDGHWNVETQRAMADYLAEKMKAEAEAKSDYSK